MGLEIDNTNFKEDDFNKFSDRLRANLKALEIMLARPGFGDGELSFGAELELYIVDQEGRPWHINQEVISKLNAPQLTIELNRYNMEYNFNTVLLKDR